MRYPFWLYFLLFAISTPCKSQRVEQWLTQAQQFEVMLKDGEAYAKYLDILQVQPDHVEALCKASEWGSTLGKRQRNKKLQQELYLASFDFARRAYKLAPNDANANFVMAISKGRLALDASGGEKIQAVRDVKLFAERAIRLAPNNYKAYHVLAKWYYEVSSLNAIEKWLVRVTYGGLPNATLQDALLFYEKSRQLNPSLLINYLELARTYNRMEQPAQAKSLLRTMLQMPNTTLDDPQIKSEGKLLLKNIE